MRSNHYQYAVIALGVIATAFFGVFLWREIYPEYRIYQKDYMALEEFYSNETGKAIPPFTEGVKQILIERKDNGPPIIDRCTSCHVALDIPHFSSTKLARDVNGGIVLDAEGIPVKIPNEDYVWGMLERKIAQLQDVEVNKQITEQGETAKVRDRLKEAERLASLATATVDGHTYNVVKALSMHPLIGRETRPFEYHSMSDYGCTSCHNGNGRGLTTAKAHGPVFDGRYEIEYLGPTPQFTEKDPLNDPQFSRMFNNKPGPDLIFQTQPIYLGELIQAKCMQCHMTSSQTMEVALGHTKDVLDEKKHLSTVVKKAFIQESQALGALLDIQRMLGKEGFAKTVQELEKKAHDYTLPSAEQEAHASQLDFLKGSVAESQRTDNHYATEMASKAVEENIAAMIGTPSLARQLEDKASEANAPVDELISKFIAAHRKNPQATGTLFKKADAVNLQEEVLQHIQNTKESFQQLVENQGTVSSIDLDIDMLTKGYQHGQNLYVSQACYACHRIAGFARGGVGPDLTNEGNGYPWFVKESIVWPQADLPTSTMPNYRLDHEELEPLMTFVMGQVGETKAIGSARYKAMIQEWENGKKMPWEMPIPPEKIHDLRYSMTIFATQGCAACHRLKGFESDVGFRIEREQKNVKFDLLYKEHEWFQKLFPEFIFGSDIVEILEKHADEIDRHIVPDARKGSLLEEIDQNYPDDIESFYTNFKFAKRAKNYQYSQEASKEKDPIKRAAIIAKLEKWKERVHRVLMVYIQEYGLGRLIGPRPNWSGIYRSDEWLMEHFHKPTAHVARSIMPAFPFDDSKFYALTYMLDMLAKHNRDAVRQIWTLRGFDPQQAAEIYCSQCHGSTLAGNGPVSEWIYPIPKNLRNADFLRNLTKERVIFSITHGVHGTPMPPWGEVAKDKPMADGIPVLTKDEIQQLANWLFGSLPGSRLNHGPREVPKWEYNAEDVIRDLYRERNQLKLEKEEQGGSTPAKHATLNAVEAFLSRSEIYYAAVQPVVNKSSDELKVEDVFDVIQNPPSDPDPYSYYIKRKFYTPENLAQGKAFFELNCAVCHGAEGDGMGVRAQIMQDAKPRMLINLNWLQTRDDLRLLRSIKFGVPGTAMTPWGDLTSSLQRLQLVMFIRSLSEDSLRLENFNEALYKAFNQANQVLEFARGQEYPIIVKAKDQYLTADKKSQDLAAKAEEDSKFMPEATKAYEEKLAAAARLAKEKKVDQILENLIDLVDQERKLYNEIGQLLLLHYIKDSFDDLLNDLEVISNRFSMKEGHLQLDADSGREEKIKKTEGAILKATKEAISQMQAQKTVLEGKVPSAETVHEMTTLAADISSFTKMKERMESSFKEAERLRAQELSLYNEYKKSSKVTLDQAPQ